jgi:hypothetical protein
MSEAITFQPGRGNPYGSDRKVQETQSNSKVEKIVSERIILQPGQGNPYARDSSAQEIKRNCAVEYRGKKYTEIVYSRKLYALERGVKVISALALTIFTLFFALFSERVRRLYSEGFQGKTTAIVLVPEQNFSSSTRPAFNISQTPCDQNSRPLQTSQPTLPPDLNPRQNAPTPRVSDQNSRPLQTSQPTLPPDLNPRQNAPTPRVSDQNLNLSQRDLITQYFSMNGDQLKREIDTFLPQTDSLAREQIPALCFAAFIRLVYNRKFPDNDQYASAMREISTALQVDQDSVFNFLRSLREKLGQNRDVSIGINFGSVVGTFRGICHAQCLARRITMPTDLVG